MNLMERSLARTTSLLLWGFICLVFSFFLAKGNIVFSGIIFAGVAYFWVYLQGAYSLSYLWLLGPPTFFVFIDNLVLASVSGVTMERIIMGTLGAKLCLDLVFNNSKQHKLTLLEGLMILFCLYALGSLFVHTDMVKLKDDLWLLLQYAMAFASFVIASRVHLDWTERDIRRLLASLSVIGVYLGVLGFLQTFDIAIIENENQVVTAGHEDRAVGPFNNAHTFSASLLIICILTLWQYTFYRDAMIRTALLGMMFVMSIGIVLGQTRAPWLGFAFSLSIVFLGDKKVRPLLVIGATVSFVIGLVILVVMADELELFFQRVTGISTIADRLAMWATATNMILDNLLFGVGFGAESFLSHKNEYITGIGPVVEQYAVYLKIPHNEYLYVTSMLGIPGLIIFIVILYKILRLMFSIYFDTSNSPMCRQLGLYVGAIISGLLVNSMFSDTMLQQYFWIITYYIAGIVAGMAISGRQSTAVDNVDDKKIAIQS